MNELQIFQNEEFGSIRMIEENGQIWFCGKDIALALGYINTKKAINDHCKTDGVTIRSLIDSLGRKQDVKFISEPNLYRLVCNSKLKSAERFEKWVFEEVLPMIRRTGSYNSGTKANNNIEETSLIVAEVIKAIVPVITKTIIEAQQKPQVVTNNLNITYKRKKKPTKRFKVEEFPEEIQRVVIRLLQNGATFDSVAEYCCDEGYEISKMSICRFYHAFFL